jgi:hypothetical protein
LGSNDLIQWGLFVGFSSDTLHPLCLIQDSFMHHSKHEMKSKTFWINFLQIFSDPD